VRVFCRSRIGFISADWWANPTTIAMEALPSLYYFI